MTSESDKHAASSSAATDETTSTVTSDAPLDRASVDSSAPMNDDSTTADPPAEKQSPLGNTDSQNADTSNRSTSNDDVKSEPSAETANNAASELAEPTPPAEAAADKPSEASRRQIKIGSQRQSNGATAPTQNKTEPAKPGADVAPEKKPAETTDSDAASPPQDVATPTAATPAEGTTAPSQRVAISDAKSLDAEVDAALGGASVDQLVESSVEGATEQLAPQSKARGRIVAVSADSVFVDLGVRQQGVIPIRQFTEVPSIGMPVEVTVISFDAGEGLYQLTLPGAAADVGDWSQLAEGMVVEARVTGTNKGGLECQVHSLRGFIPASQASLLHVDNLEEFVDKQLPCVVLEVNPRRRKLVLSHRAHLEREREAARDQLLQELAPGQIREGVVQNLREFGAFVDLGGIDGLLHVSQMSWSRVQHPKEVLEVGQTVRVKVLKINPQTRKISLGLKDLTPNPWTDAAERYAPKTTVDGTVSKITDFGAFVELEPGVEGMIHISELAHRHVNKVTEVVQEGQDVKAQVLSVESGKRRIALSLKALETKPESGQKPARAKTPPKKRVHDPNLKGGVGGDSGGEKFGLKW